MNLRYIKFKEISLSDPFFDSLKQDYSEFSAWFAAKAESYAYVSFDDVNAINGFLYLKVEDGTVSDVVPPLASARRLKVGTFKINAHGTRMGERFLRKIFDHALYEHVAEIYVTVFPRHEGLMALFERYGFVRAAAKTTGNGTEDVLVKSMRTTFNDVVRDYPLIRVRGDRTFLMALKPVWHTRLLPDSILKNEDAAIVQDISHSNSIHKVYLTAMRGTEDLRRGDVLVIYRTSDEASPAHYRSVATSLCVVEEVRDIASFRDEQEFLNYCAPYSVFTINELEDFYRKKRYPVIIRFTYNFALKKRVTRKYMIETLGVSADRYWGFFQLSGPEFKGIVSEGRVDENLIVY